MTDQERVTVAEAAKILEVSGSMVSHYLAAEKLSATKEGRCKMIPLTEVLKLKESKGKKGGRGDAKKRDLEPKKSPQVAQEASPSAAPPTPVAPPENPVSEVPVRSVVELTDKGRVWRMDMESKEWEQITDGVSFSVIVNERADNGGIMFLLCKAPDSQAQWGILESDVLGGNHNLVSRPIAIPQAPPTVVSTPQEQPPVVAEPEPKSVPEEPSEEEKEAGAKAMFDKKVELARKTAYSKALHTYVPANEAKLRAASDFDKVDKECRPVIWSYLEDFGEESEEGKRNNVVEDFGYRAILTFTPGKPVVQRDTTAIVNWAMENGHTEILTYGINIDKWDELKEAGVVPSDVVAAVEKVEKTKDIRKLVINRLKGEATTK